MRCSVHLLICVPHSLVFQILYPGNHRDPVFSRREVLHQDTGESSSTRRGGSEQGIDDVWAGGLILCCMFCYQQHFFSQYRPTFNWNAQEFVFSYASIFSRCQRSLWTCFFGLFFFFSNNNLEWIIFPLRTKTPLFSFIQIVRQCRVLVHHIGPCYCIATPVFPWNYGHTFMTFSNLQVFLWSTSCCKF